MASPRDSPVSDVAPRQHWSLSDPPPWFGGGGGARWLSRSGRGSSRFSRPGSQEKFSLTPRATPLFRGFGAARCSACCGLLVSRLRLDDGRRGPAAAVSAVTQRSPHGHPPDSTSATGQSPPRLSAALQRRRDARQDGAPAPLSSGWRWLWHAGDSRPRGRAALFSKSARRDGSHPQQRAGVTKGGGPCVQGMARAAAVERAAAAGESEPSAEWGRGGGQAR